MLNYNRVILIGRLTADPELKTTQSGIPVTGFSLAVNRRSSLQGGEPKADFISCVVWKQSAENLTRYCTKGSAILIEGELQTRSYTAQDGSKRYVCEVAVFSWQFAESKKNVSEASSAQVTQPAPAQQAIPATGAANPVGIPDSAAVQFESLGSDDDLPF